MLAHGSGINLGWVGGGGGIEKSRAHDHNTVAPFCWWLCVGKGCALAPAEFAYNLECCTTRSFLSYLTENVEMVGGLMVGCMTGTNELSW